MSTALPIGDEPLAQRSRRAGPPSSASKVIALVAALSVCGCRVGITHKFEVVSRAHLDGIELAPDGNRVAIGVTVDHIHEPNSLGAFPDGGMWIYDKRTFEVLVFDLRRLEPLRRI